MRIQRRWRTGIRGWVLAAACGQCFLLGGGCDKDTIRQAVFEGTAVFIQDDLLGNVQTNDLLPLVDILTGFIPTAGT